MTLNISGSVRFRIEFLFFRIGQGLTRLFKERSEYFQTEKNIYTWIIKNAYMFIFHIFMIWLYDISVYDFSGTQPDLRFGPALIFSLQVWMTLNISGSDPIGFGMSFDSFGSGNGWPDYSKNDLNIFQLKKIFILEY